MHGAASAIGRNKETPMPLYEHVFLARQDLSQAQVDALDEHEGPRDGGVLGDGRRAVERVAHDRGRVLGGPLHAP